MRIRKDAAKEGDEHRIAKVLGVKDELRHIYEAQVDGEVAENHKEHRGSVTGSRHLYCYFVVMA